MAIVPDTKDWTWVLEKPCAECGFDASAVARKSLPDRIRSSADEFRVELASRPDVAERPAPDVWSPLEYSCHVRDVFRRFDQRLEHMLTEDDPRFANWDQDASAVEGRYGEQDPSTVAGELGAAAARIADRYQRVRPDEWQRRGQRSDGAGFTVESLGRYLVHDVVHHIHDVTGRRFAVTPPG